MPSLVLDLDVTMPPGDIAVEARYDHVHALLRWDGTPVGSAWLRAQDGRVGAAQLREVLEPLQSRIARLRVERWIGGATGEPWTGESRPTVTIAICTRDRPDDLALCLTAICSLPDDGQSVLVVDSASRDEATRDVVARFARVRYVREERPGLDRARNRALREATTDIVAFIDDDAVPDPGWLRALAREFADPRTLCVTGLTAPLQLETPAQEWFERTNAFARGFDRVVHDGAVGSPFVASRVGAGVNMALRRRVLQAVGPFDEALDAGTATRSGGDHDMFTRILAAGYCIAYQPAALVRHRHRRSWSDLRSTVEGYGTGVYAYLIGHLLQGEIGAVRVALAWHWSQLRTIVRALVVPGERPAASLALAELAGCAAGPIAYRRARRVAARPVVEPDRSADVPSLAGTRSPCAGAARPPAAGSDALRLSVIVPTHDRRERLLHLLATLAGSAYPPERYEVIVVADGCTDGTVEALGMCVLPFPLTVACVSPGAGAAAARNRGAGMARGELLLFLDDDMEPLDGLLAEHDARHRAIEARGERGVVIGAPLPVRHGRDSFHHVAMWSWWETQFARMQAPGHRFTHEEVFSGVLSLPARLFDEVGRFDERLHCREDSELGVRLLSAGLRVEFTRSGGGWHHDLRGAPRLASRKRAEGRADVQLAERYPELWPGLRLSWPQRPWWTPMGAVRRLATVSAQPGEAFASILMALLPLLEGLRQRTWWRAAHAALVYFWYWRGVADAGAATGAQLDARARAASHASPPRELEVGVEDGLETVEQRLDALRPDTLRLTVGGRPWVTIPAVPGAEPLRGAHLRPALVRALRAAPDAVRILPLEPARGTEFLRPVAMPSVER